MNTIPNARSIADVAKIAAGYVLIAPPDQRDAVTASVAEAFRNECTEHSIPIQTGDMAYYMKVVTAKVAEMTSRLVEIELNAKGK